MDELYHFSQYLKFKYQSSLQPAIEAVEDEIDAYDAKVALQEPGENISLDELKQELDLS